jgi:excisionase family DNA binding protein
MDPVLLTPEQVARLLQLGRTKVFELIISGQIESVKIGKCRRIPPDAVHAYAARLRAEQEVA